MKPPSVFVFCLAKFLHLKKISHTQQLLTYNLMFWSAYTCMDINQAHNELHLCSDKANSGEALIPTY